MVPTQISTTLPRRVPGSVNTLATKFSAEISSYRRLPGVDATDTEDTGLFFFVTVGFGTGAVVFCIGVSFFRSFRPGWGYLPG